MKALAALSHLSTTHNAVWTPAPLWTLHRKSKSEYLISSDDSRNVGQRLDSHINVLIVLTSRSHGN
jgi:hypothetical protein